MNRVYFLDKTKICTNPKVYFISDSLNNTNEGTAMCSTLVSLSMY